MSASSSSSPHIKHTPHLVRGHPEPGYHRLQYFQWPQELPFDRLMLHTVPGDGDCFYHCIKQALGEIKPTYRNITVTQIRNACAEYLLENADCDYIFGTHKVDESGREVPQSCGPKKRAHAAKIRRSGEWAEYIEISLIHRGCLALIGVTELFAIDVYLQDLTDPTVIVLDKISNADNIDRSNRTTLRVYYNGWHYDRLLLAPGSASVLMPSPASHRQSYPSSSCSLLGQYRQKNEFINRNIIEKQQKRIHDMTLTEAERDIAKAIHYSFESDRKYWLDRSAEPSYTLKSVAGHPASPKFDILEYLNWPEELPIQDVMLQVMPSDNCLFRCIKYQLEQYAEGRVKFSVDDIRNRCAEYLERLNRRSENNAKISEFVDKLKMDGDHWDGSKSNFYSIIEAIQDGCLKGLMDATFVVDVYVPLDNRIEKCQNPQQNLVRTGRLPIRMLYMDKCCHRLHLELPPQCETAPTISLPPSLPKESEFDSKWEQWEQWADADKEIQELLFRNFERQFKAESETLNPYSDALVAFDNCFNRQVSVVSDYLDFFSDDDDDEVDEDSERHHGRGGGGGDAVNCDPYYPIQQDSVFYSKLRDVAEELGRRRDEDSRRSSQISYGRHDYYSCGGLFGSMVSPKKLPGAQKVSNKLPFIVEERLKEVTSEDGSESVPCNFGLFPEIEHAWASIGNMLYLWRYNETNIATPIQVSSDAGNMITSVCISTSSAVIGSVGEGEGGGGVGDEAEYIIAVATHREVRILAVHLHDGAAAPEVNLLEDLIASNNGVVMVKLVGSRWGRIYMIGEDSLLYELTYTISNAWHSDLTGLGAGALSCSNVLKSNLLWNLRTLLPFSIRNFFGVYQVRNILIDNSRHLLYTIADKVVAEDESSSDRNSKNVRKNYICIHSLDAEGGTLGSVVECKLSIQEMVLEYYNITNPSPDKLPNLTKEQRNLFDRQKKLIDLVMELEVVDSFVTSVIESSTYCFVVVLSEGTRVYLDFNGVCMEVVRVLHLPEIEDIMAYCSSSSSDNNRLVATVNATLSAPLLRQKIENFSRNVGGEGPKQLDTVDVNVAAAVSDRDPLDFSIKLEVLIKSIEKSKMELIKITKTYYSKGVFIIGGNPIVYNTLEGLRSFLSDPERFQGGDLNRPRDQFNKDLEGIFWAVLNGADLSLLPSEGWKNFFLKVAKRENKYKKYLSIAIFEDSRGSGDAGAGTSEIVALVDDSLDSCLSDGHIYGFAEQYMMYSSTSSIDEAAALVTPYCLKDLTLYNALTGLRLFMEDESDKKYQDADLKRPNSGNYDPRNIFAKALNTIDDVDQLSYRGWKDFIRNVAKKEKNYEEWTDTVLQNWKSFFLKIAKKERKDKKVTDFVASSDDISPLSSMHPCSNLPRFGSQQSWGLSSTNFEGTVSSASEILLQHVPINGGDLFRSFVCISNKGVHSLQKLRPSDVFMQTAAARIIDRGEGRKKISKQVLLDYIKHFSGTNDFPTAIIDQDLLGSIHQKGASRECLVDLLGCMCGIGTPYSGALVADSRQVIEDYVCRSLRRLMIDDNPYAFCIPPNPAMERMVDSLKCNMLIDEWYTLVSRVLRPIYQLPMCSRSSRYRGVSWHHRSNKWLASFTTEGGRPKRLGFYKDEKAAAKAFDAEVLRRKDIDDDVLNFGRKGKAGTGGNNRFSEFRKYICRFRDQFCNIPDCILVNTISALKRIYKAFHKFYDQASRIDSSDGGVLAPVFPGATRLEERINLGLYLKYTLQYLELVQVLKNEIFSPQSMFESLDLTIPALVSYIIPDGLDDNVFTDNLISEQFNITVQEFLENILTAKYELKYNGKGERDRLDSRLRLLRIELSNKIHHEFKYFMSEDRKYKIDNPDFDDDSFFSSPSSPSSPKSSSIDHNDDHNDDDSHDGNNSDDDEDDEGANSGDDHSDKSIKLLFGFSSLLLLFLVIHILFSAEYDS